MRAKQATSPALEDCPATAKPEQDLDIEGAIHFHGHWCPGLAIGIRVAEVALAVIGPHSSDEEVVAIVEADNCAVDAIQYFTGCTFGKGNLIHRDYGKNVFTFLRRSDGKAIRVTLRPEARSETSPDHRELQSKVQSGRATTEETQRVAEFRKQRIESILTQPADELLRVERVSVPMPRKAQIRRSVICERCGESTMETRVRILGGKPYCLPCYRTIEDDSV